MANLITVQEYKTARSITKTDKDEQLELLVPAVSNLIQAYIGHPILEQENTEDIVNTAFPSNYIRLSGFPILDIVSLEESVSVDAYGLDSTIHYIAADDEIVGWTYNPLTGSIIRNSGNWGTTVTVVYNTGYEEVPEDLKLAAIQLVDFYLKEQYIQSRSIAGVGVSQTLSKDIPVHIKMLLDNYII